MPLSAQQRAPVVRKMSRSSQARAWVCDTEERRHRTLSLGLVLLSSPVTLPCLLFALVLAALATRSLRRLLIWQERVGRHGRVFRMLKVRTMTEVDPTFQAWAAGDRHRTTRLGRWIRATHLDEVPQLLNVLRGDMNLVGPRPELVEVHGWATGLVRGFDRRLAVRPGLTGWAQLEVGYTREDPEAYALKLAFDLRYLQHRSLRTDLVLMLRTPFVILRRLRHPD